MVSVVERAPLSMNSVVAETEKFLPPDQVQAGRERIRQENERIRQMSEQHKTPSKAAADPLAPYLKPQDEIMAESRARMIGDAAPQPAEAAEHAAPAVPVAPAVTVATRPAATMPAVVAATDVDGWTRYVQTFIDKYQFDDRQKQQSWQIHGELKKRAEEYRTAHKSDYRAVDRIENKKLAGPGAD